MKSLAVSGFSEAEVLDQLVSRKGARQISFRYERLNSANVLLGAFPGIRPGGNIDHDAFALIKRVAKFDAKDDPSVNYLSDRIKPWMRLLMPSGVWVEWPLGVFLMSSPTLRRHTEGKGLRKIDAYDQTVILSSVKIPDRKVIAAETVVTTEIGSLLAANGIPLRSITPSTKTLPAAREWDPGTTILEIVNDLLEAINYLGLWFDSNGYAIGEPYISPSQKPVDGTYLDDAASVLLPQAEVTSDLFGVPNQWILVVSEPEMTPLRSVYTNTSASSPTSTVNRGFTITDYREGQKAVDQATLDAMAARAANEASQVYDRINVETALMPHHEHMDMLKVRYQDLNVDGKVQEVYWSMQLAPGGRMQHTFRKNVVV